MTAVVWAEAGSGAEPGRLRRARALARALAARGLRCRFVLPPEAETVAWLAAAGLPTSIVPPGREPGLRGVLGAATEAIAVVADVARPLQVLEARALRANGRVLVAVETPGPGAADADLVVAPFGEPRGERWLAGPAHAPVESPLASRRRPASGPRPVVLVDLEGPHAEALLPAVEALARIPGVRAHARVLADPGGPVWARLAGLLGRLDLAPARAARPGALVAHLAAADVAVLGFGPGVHEALAAGVAPLVLCRRAAEAAALAPLAARGALRHLAPGWRADDVASVLGALLADWEGRAAMARAGWALVDGRGGERVAARLLGLLAGRGLGSADGRVARV
ncbi:MAG TPA: hypothetical protein VKW76_10785 [Candidatus Binatia bacterium]|nr:hypothetical protein [Candidatus Binatia bacterium]